MEFQYELLQLPLKIVIHKFHFGALVEGFRIDVAFDDIAHVRRNIIPHALARQNPESIPHVVGLHAIFLYFVHLVDEQADQGLFKPVGNFCLHGRIGFGPWNGNGRCAEGLEHRGPERGWRDTDFEALEIVGLENRARGRCGLPETVIPRFFHADQSGFGK